MASEAKTFKQYAKEAKNRMKTGFWKKYHENLEKEVARAEQAGIEQLTRDIERDLQKGG